jgi:outer membrane lipoprotein-sorting protein
MFKKIQSDNRGVAHLLYIILAVIVAIVIGFGDWRLITENKTPTKSNSSVASNGISSSCLSIYHDNNICHFSESSTTFSKTTYTAELTNTQNGTTSTMTLENDGKGNTELTSNSGDQTINSITLDGTSYIQDNGTGPWVEYPSGTNSPSTNPTSTMSIGVGSPGIIFKYIDTESCGGLTCFKYRVTDRSTPTTTQYVLFDNSSYMLRQWQYSDGSGNSTSMTVNYQAVNITKPSPVESLSSLGQ